MSDSKIGSEMEKLGRKMVQQCGGLPLAISVLGGFLKEKDTLRDWEMVSIDISSYLSRGEGTEGAVRRVLDLSFNDLPYHLKQCFLYLGKFSEDRSIYAKKLYLLWTSQGMVSLDDQRKGESMIDVAERYLGELAQRSMVQVEVGEGLTSYTKFGSCRLHDVMRDQILPKGKNDHVHKVFELERHKDGLEIDLSWAVKTNTEDDRHEMTRYHRSLLFHNCSNSYETFRWPKEISSLEVFKSLRVLDFEWIDFRETMFPKQIGELIHMRYLSFRDCELSEFPTHMDNMRYLQTLDLRTRKVENPIRKPNFLRKMERVRHLYLPREICIQKGQKLKLDGLRELETLENFDVGGCDLNDLVKFSNLQSVDIRSIKNVEELGGIMNHLNVTFNHIRYSSLEISNCGDMFSEEEGTSLLRNLLSCPRLNWLQISGRICKLPDCHDFSPSLTYLCLEKSQLEEDPMPTLEKFPNLHFLVLASNAFMGKEMICSATGFPELRTLMIFELSNLEKWRVDEGAMPNLSNTIINGCEKLEMLPDGFRFLTSLRSLFISGMPEAFKKRIQVIDGEEGQDCYKVRHVPSIDIRDVELIRD